MTERDAQIYDLDAIVPIPWRGRAAIPVYSRRITIRHAALRYLFAEISDRFPEKEAYGYVSRARVRVLMHGGVQCITMDSDMHHESIYLRLPIKHLLVLIRAGIYPAD